MLITFVCFSELLSKKPRLVLPHKTTYFLWVMIQSEALSFLAQTYCPLMVCRFILSQNWNYGIIHSHKSTQNTWLSRTQKSFVRTFEQSCKIVEYWFNIFGIKSINCIKLIDKPFSSRTEEAKREAENEVISMRVKFVYKKVGKPKITIVSICCSPRLV